MGGNRRDRVRERRDARTAAASAPPGSQAPRKPRPGWRRTLDSFGGFAVVVPLLLTVIAAIVLLARQPLGLSQSDDALMGDEVAFTSSPHVADGTLGERGPQPPAGGAHYTVPQPVGAYDEVLDDGHLIHSLEHGIVWIAYDPEQVTAEELEGLRQVYDAFSGDVILAPRPENDEAVYVMSWGRRLSVSPDDTDTLRKFVETNRNRSPEPGMR